MTLKQILNKIIDFFKKEKDDKKDNEISTKTVYEATFHNVLTNSLSTYPEFKEVIIEVLQDLEQNYIEDLNESMSYFKTWREAEAFIYHFLFSSIKSKGDNKLEITQIFMNKFSKAISYLIWSFDPEAAPPKEGIKYILNQPKNSGKDFGPTHGNNLP
ncbi:MAG: hypothetical protein K9L56_14470 [Clostridiales bacterium]|nr:hypothetical protein [Clostridiales bacterium]